jgi:hypothetical protein
MRIDDFDSVPAHVTSSNGTLRVFLEEGNFLVKIYKDSDLVWEDHISDLQWTSFGNNNELIDWRIEFWDDILGKMISIHYHLVHGSNVLIVPVIKDSSDNVIESIIDECNRVKSLGGIPWTFFEGCYKFRDLLLKEGINLFSIGESTESIFPYIIEKEY